MRLLKNIWKLFAAFLVTVGLLILAGFWRLTEAPLRLPVHFSKVRELVQSYGVDFEDIYLSCPSLYSLPHISIHEGHLETESVGIHVHRMEIAWYFRELILNRRIRVKSVALDGAEFSFKESAKGSTEWEIALPEVFDFPFVILRSATVKTLPNGKSLPRNSINASFYKKGAYTSLRYYAKAFFGDRTTLLEGKISLNKKTVKGIVSLSQWLPRDWENLLSDDLRSWAHFFDKPLNVSTKVAGKIGEKGFGGVAKLHADMPYIRDHALHYVPVDLQVLFQKKEEKVSGTFAANLKPFPWDMLSQLWPVGLSPTVRTWCVDQIHGGEAHAASVKGNLSFDASTHDFSVTGLTGKLGVSGASVDYIDQMPSVDNASAQAHFTNEKFIIDIAKGHTKQINVLKGQVRFEDLHTQKEKGFVDIHMEGPLEEALWVADHPPLQFASQYGFRPQDVTGESKIHLELSFPLDVTPTIQSIEPKVQADIAGLKMKKEILGKNLLIEKGDFVLGINRETLSLKGNAQIDKKPASIQWTENLLPKAKFLRHYKVGIPISANELLGFSPKTVQEFFKNTKEFSLKGNTLLMMDYMEKDSENSTLLLNLDLQGSALSFPLFAYEKPTSKPGKAFLKMRFDKNGLSSIETLNLSAETLDVQSSLGFNEKGEFVSAEVKKALVGPSHFTLSLMKQPHLWTVSLRGASFNLISFMDFYKGQKEEKNAEQSKENIDCTFDFAEITLKNDVILPMAKGRLNWRGGALEHYSLSSIKDKEPFLNVAYHEGAEEDHFHLTTAGLDVLAHGFDITDTIRAGDVTIDAKRVHGSEKPFAGTVDIRAFRIKDAPILAKLISLASIEGLLSTLTGEGILFVTGEAEFEYDDQKIALQHLELASSALGLTAKGYVDIKKDGINVEGYVIPANILNQLIGNIPLIGTILSGGKKEHKGLFSVSYSMKGALSDPETSSNPLSVLAPNFVKGLFSGLSKSELDNPTLQEKTEE